MILRCQGGCDRAGDVASVRAGTNSRVGKEKKRKREKKTVMMKEGGIFTGVRANLTASLNRFLQFGYAFSFSCMHLR